MSRRRRPTPLSQAGNTLFIPDPHAPYQSRGIWRFLEAMKRLYDPSRVVFLGDVIDGLTASRYVTHSAAKGADDEFREACRVLRRLAKMFPIADVVWGNHDLRSEKKASEVGIPSQRITPIYEVPALRDPLRGWTWHYDLKLPGRVTVTHGDGIGGQNPGEAAVLKYRSNVVMGHLHTRFGVTWFARGTWRNWAMNCGCLVNPESPAASYAIHHQKRPILGAGVLVRGKTPLVEAM